MLWMHQGMDILYFCWLSFWLLISFVSTAGHKYWNITANSQHHCQKMYSEMCFAVNLLMHKNLVMSIPWLVMKNFFVRLKRMLISKSKSIFCGRRKTSSCVCLMCIFLSMFHVVYGRKAINFRKKNFHAK